MVSITIENLSSIDLDNEFLLRIVKIANLPTGELLLILSKNGLGKHYGGCIHRSVLKYTASGSVFRLFKDKPWDVGVALSKDICADRVKYPAFFTYLLGHELGHTYICLSDKKIHIFGCLLDDFYNRVAKKKLRGYEFPHEKRFDQFGIYIAEQLFSRDKLNNEIAKLLNVPSRKDHRHLNVMLNLIATDILSDLKSVLISFAEPYKERLIELWQKDVAERNGKALASLIDNFENLFSNTCTSK